MFGLYGAFAAGDDVARQFDALPGAVAVADELGDGRGGHERSFQVAVLPWPEISFPRTRAASTGPATIWSAISLRSIRTSVRLLGRVCFSRLISVLACWRVFG